MATTPSLVDTDPIAAAVKMRRVEAHINELRRTGRAADADAVAFVRDVAEQALTGAGGHEPGRPRALLTTGDAGLALGLSDQTVRNWVTAGRLPAVKRGIRTMIPREAVLAEIERSRVVPGQPRRADVASAHDQDSASTAEAGGESQATSLAWRQELLTALPRAAVERLDALHERREDGQSLTMDEEAELIRLEREMADTAACHLQKVIRRGGAGAA